MLTLTRRADWPERLGAAFVAARAEPAVYGTLDCFQWVRRAVIAMTDHDIAPAGLAYTTPAGAARALRRAGAEDLAAWFSGLFPPVAPGQAVTGDLAVIDTAEGPAAALIMDGELAVVTSAGLDLISRAAIVAAWRVG